MSDDWDPLIHGPRVGDVVIEPVPTPNKSSQALVTDPSRDALSRSADPPYDLRVTQPIQDLWALIRRPRDVLQFFAEPEHIDRWVIFKAVGGMLLMSWLAEFVAGGRWIGTSLSQSLPLLDRLSGDPMFAALDIARLKEKLTYFIVATSHLKMILAPLWDLVDATGLAASAVLFLPLMGVPRARISFYSVFFALAYVRWLFVLTVIPGVGPTFTPLIITIVSILAIKWIYGISFFKSFASTYLLYWLSLALIPLFGAFLLAALVFSHA